MDKLKTTILTSKVTKDTMNNQKDIQKIGLNSYGQDVSSQGQSLSYKPSLPTVGTKYEFANKKTEKLVTALYMVTDCMETDDSLKGKLRQLGVELLSDMYKLSILSPMDKSVHISSSLARVYEILSFIEIAYTIGFISDMNTAILKKEFNTLISELESHLSKDKHFTFTLDEKMFETNFTDKETGDSLKDTPKETEKKIAPSMISFGNKKTNDTLHNSVPKVVNHKDNILGKKERSDKILSLIKDKKEVSIKDISVAFSCSEKTVQREMNDLIYKGQVKKSGSKRWSRYTLV